MIKIIGIAVISLILSLIVGKENRVFALLICIGGTLLIFSLVTDEINGLISVLDDLQGSIGIAGGFISIMMKILGISIITQIVCDMCRDNGKAALASQTEIASKIAVVALLLPMFKTIINIVTGLTK